MRVPGSTIVGSARSLELAGETFIIGGRLDLGMLELRLAQSMTTMIMGTYSDSETIARANTLNRSIQRFIDLENRKTRLGQ